jgi:hypothetical protein
MARDRLLDAFFHLELAVTKWLRHLGEDDRSQPLGHRLKKLVGHAQLSAKATRKQREQIEALEACCAQPLKLRNALIHSSREHSQIGIKSDKPCLFLVTIDCALADDHSFFVVTLEELEQAARAARKIAGDLTNYLTQASSPPRPSPA